MLYKCDYKKTLQYFIGALFFLFPILSVLVKDWVSLTFLILTLGGMTYGLKSWKILTFEEKRIFVGFAIFCGLIALSFFKVDDVREGFRYFEKYTSFLFAIFPYLFLRKLDFNFTKHFIAGAVIAPYIWIVYYVLSGENRFVGAYPPIFIGNIAALLACLSIIYLITVANTNLKKIVSIMTFVLATIVAVLSQTRGAWIYYPVFLFIIVLMYRKNITHKQWGAGVIIIIFTVSLLVIMPPEIIKSRINRAIADYHHFQMGETKKNSDERLYIWQDSIEMFKKSPILGVGVSDFQNESRILRIKGESKTRNLFGHAHSIYFNTLATIGLIGFVGLIILVFLLPYMFFLRIWRKNYSAEFMFYSLSGITLITAFLVFGLTESWLSRNPFVRSYLIIIVLLMNSIMLSSKKNKT